MGSVLPEHENYILPEHESYIGHLVQNLTTAIRAERKRVDITFPEFYRLVLGVDMPPYQRAIIDEVLSAKQCIILAPPGHAKSTLVCALMAWYLGHNPNLRIIVATHTISYSESLLSFVESIMRSSQYIALFGELCPPPGTQGWTTDQKTLLRPNAYIKDPSLKALGVGSSTIGYRADMIVADDLVTFSNSQTPVMRKHVSDWFWGNLYTRLEPNGKLVIIGARFYAQDLYGELLAKLPTRFVFRSSPEEPLWPERYGKEFLERMREQNYFAYMAQYQQRPLDLEANILQESWLQYYIIRPERLTVYFGVDPCVSASGDYFVCAVLGTDDVTGTIYLLDLIRGRYSMEEQMQRIQEAYEYWKPVLIGVESNAAQAFLAERLENAGLPIQRIYHEIPKAIRIMSMASHFRSGKVLLPGVWSESGYIQPQPFLEPFLDEWRSFGTTSIHDDTLDATEIALQLAMRISVMPAVSTASPEPVEEGEEEIPPHYRLPRFAPPIFDRSFGL